MRERPCLLTAAAAGPLTVAIALAAVLAIVSPLLVLAPLAVLLWLHKSPKKRDSIERHSSLSVVSANMLLGNKRIPEAVSKLMSLNPDVLLLVEASPEAIAHLPKEGSLNYSSETECGLLEVAIWSPHKVIQDGFMAAGSRRFPLYRVQTPSSRWLVSPVHLTAPNVPSRRRFWKRQIESLSVSIPRHTPDVITGDFNASWCNPEFRKMCLSTKASPSGGLLSRILPSWGPRGFVSLLRLDHVLTRPGINSGRLRLHRVPGSDHRALSVVLSRVPHSAEGRQRTHL